MSTRGRYSSTWVAAESEAVLSLVAGGGWYLQGKIILLESYFSLRSAEMIGLEAGV